jgi:hypothetical protein
MSCLFARGLEIIKDGVGTQWISLPLPILPNLHWEGAQWIIVI